MVSWPLQRIGEAFIDGQWVSVPLRESTQVTITRGIGAEGSAARPGSMSVKVNDAAAVYSPRNVESELYGTFGRGTPFRFRVGDVPATPAATMTDTFARTVANGWGSADSGQTWTIYDPVGISPPASEYSVSGGAAKITTSTYNSARYITTNGASFGDFEATFTIATDTVPVDSSAEEGVAFPVLLRVNRTATTLYIVEINLLNNTGLPDNRGLRVLLLGTRFDSVSSGAPVANHRQIPSLSYAAGSRLRVRVRCEGPELRARVWPDGDAEPGHWHWQGYDDTYTAGEFGFGMSLRGDDTPVPVSASWTDLTIRPLTAAADTVRLSGELAALDPYEDESGPAAAYVDLDVAGVLRRYDGSSKPVKSALRRRLQNYGPVAYWAFEEGAQGDTYVAQVGAQSAVGPLTVSGLDFAKDDTLVGSGPLPTVQAGGRLLAAGITSTATGYWSVYLMVKLTTDGFPTDASKHQVLRFATGNTTLTLSAQLTGGQHYLVLDAVAADGTALGVTAGVSHESLLANGNLGLLDRWQQVKIYAEPSGANTAFVLALLDPDTSGLTSSVGAVSVSVDRVRSISTTFGTGVKGMGIGHLTIWGIAFNSAYTSMTTPAGPAVAFELGAPGLAARDWMTMLSCDQAAALEAYGPGETPLGPFPQDTFMSLVRAAAETDMGLLVERRDQLALQYISRQSLYNRPVDLVLDYSSGMVFAPFQPKDDDKDLFNQVTARRKAGSEATAELTEGPLSTQAPPDGIGIADTSADTLVQSDDQLPDQAGWRLHLGTWDEMRVASLTLKMANTRMRGLLDTVLALREGSRVQVIRTPKRYGPDGFDLLVRGTKETHGEGVFDITLNCVPYGPYTVGAVAVYEDFEDTTYAVSFTNGGNASWARSSAHFNNGGWSLRSGSISNNQTSDWIVSVPVGATEMRFWYWTSSENSGTGFEGDRLLVLVDGAQVLRAQGTTGWTQKIVSLAGASTVTFRYAKDNSSTAGEDAVHIDDLSFTGLAPVKADTAGCELYAAASSTATALSVVTTQGPIWTRDPVQLPFNLKVGGEEVRATAIASWCTDAFARTVASGWGSADTGQAWTVVGGAGASDFSVGSGAGSHLLGSVDVSRRCGVDHTHADVDVVVSVTTSATATGGSLYGGPVGRYIDSSNLYHARVEFTTGNAINLDLRKRSGVSEVSLGTYASGITHVAGTYVRVRLQVQGSRLRAKIWAASAAEPEAWHIDRIDTTLTTSAFVGCRSITAVGNTNVNPSVRYDNFEVLNPQVITATRSVNGAVKAQSAGTAVRLARPAIAAL